MIITPIQPTGNFSTCAVMFACIPVQMVYAYTKSETDALLADKQKLLIAGDNITIETDGTISSSGGGGASIHNDLLQRDAADAHPISAISGLQTELDAKQQLLTAGTNITIDVNNIISASGGSELVFEDKYADTIKRWEIKCLTGTAKEYGKFNSATQLFECNGILDIGLDEASLMLQTFGGPPQIYSPSYNNDNLFRTTLSIMGDTEQEFRVISPNNLFNGIQISSVRLTTDVVVFRDDWSTRAFVYYTRTIPIILGIVRFEYNTTLTKHFENLVDFQFIIGKSDATSFDWDMSSYNQVASFGSLFFLVNRWGNTSNPLATTRTLTLHIDLYDKIYNPANPDYATYSPLATEATRKNINISTP